MGLFDFLKKKAPEVKEEVKEVAEKVETKVEEVVADVKEAVQGVTSDVAASNVVVLGAVSDGTVVDISEVPDPAFAQKMVGDGYAIQSSTGVFVAPVDAEVALVFPTKHAIGLRTERGDEIIIHVGLDTVSLGGEGFEVFVEQGDKVVAGDRLLKADFAFLESKGLPTITPVVVSDMTNRRIELAHTGEVVAGAPVANVVLEK